MAVRDLSKDDQGDKRDMLELMADMTAIRQCGTAAALVVKACFKL